MIEPPEVRQARKTLASHRRETREARPKREKEAAKVVATPGEATMRRAISRYRRTLILDRQNRCCAACAKPFDVTMLSSGVEGVPGVPMVGPFEIDHALPLELGGSDTDENLQALCWTCHRLKTANDMKRIAKMRRQSKLNASKSPSKHFRTWGRG